MARGTLSGPGRQAASGHSHAFPKAGLSLAQLIHKDDPSVVDPWDADLAADLSAQAVRLLAQNGLVPPLHCGNSGLYPAGSSSPPMVATGTETCFLISAAR